MKVGNYSASHAAIKQGLRISLTQQKELVLEMIQCFGEHIKAIRKQSKDANSVRSITDVIETLSLDLIAFKNSLTRLAIDLKAIQLIGLIRLDITKKAMLGGLPLNSRQRIDCLGAIG